MTSRHVATAAIATGSLIWAWRRLAQRDERRRQERHVHLVAILEASAAPAAIQDLTERRLQAHTNARLAAIVEASNDAIVSKALDGTIQTWNAGAERLYGYTAAEMIGHDVTRLLPPDRLDEEKHLLGRATQGETLPQHETRRMRKDGRIIEVSLSMAPMRDDDGRIIGASTVGHDITARVEAEKRLRVEREQLKMIMWAAAEPFLTTDSSGVITEWNRQAEQVFGWPRAEIIGRTATDTVLPRRYRAAVRRFLDGEWDSLLDRSTELVALHRDGHELPVELTMWRIRHDGSAYLHAFARDISARLETDQALAEARDQAIETARLKSQFLASMSHEIRTPMNGVIGLTGLLLGSRLDAQQRKYAEGIGTAGSALLSVINDVLDFSKLEAGKVLLEDTNFQLHRLVDDVVSLVAPPGRAGTVTVTGRCDSRLPATVSGDAAKLRQVLLNLAGNAIKFTAYGTVSISVTRDEDEPEQGGIPVRFEVRDTGIGIDDHQRETLFEPFTQADAGTTRRFGGTGLGLAISRDLVQVMGGHIGVHSEPALGSTFWFTVRLRAARAGLDLSDNHSLDGLRVLIIDRDETGRSVLAGQLAAWSMQAAVAGSSEEGRDILRDAAATGRPVDLVIQDVHTAGVLPHPPDGTPVPKTILLADDPRSLPGELDPSLVSAAFTKPLRQSQLYDALAGVLVSTDKAASTPRTAPSGRGHLLLVEDNDINRTVALGILATLGYSADVAANGREAVEMAFERGYQLIFMDCLMPEMDGYAATAAIRRREGPGRHIPIVALTASALAEDRARCLDAGMDDHIAKPLIPSDVARALDRWAGTTPRDPIEAIAARIEERLDQLRGPTPAESAPAIERLLRSMAGRIPEHLENVSQALALDDAATLRNEAHQLKGIMANIGATEAAAACDRLEAEARRGDLDAAVDALAALRPAAAAVRKAVALILRAPAVH